MNFVVLACLDAVFGLSNKRDCKEESHITISEHEDRVTKGDAPEIVDRQQRLHLAHIYIGCNASTLLARLVRSRSAFMT